MPEAAAAAAAADPCCKERRRNSSTSDHPDQEGHNNNNNNGGRSVMLDDQMAMIMSKKKKKKKRRATTVAEQQKAKDAAMAFALSLDSTTPHFVVVMTDSHVYHDFHLVSNPIPFHIRPLLKRSRFGFQTCSHYNCASVLSTVPD